MAKNKQPNSHASPFFTTRWTRVCLAKADSEDGRRALAELCDAYYEPVVAYLRSVFKDADAAREMSHAFFAEMLGGGTIHAAECGRGRFRSYLLGAVKHFASRQHESARRLKRGGGVEFVSLDDAEEITDIPDLRQISPDAEYDRQWAVSVLAHGMEALREECVAERREVLFEVIKPLLSGNAGRGDQSALAASCGMSSDAFRMAVQRLKKRLRQCVKNEIAGTLDDPSGIQDEMQALFAALGR